MTMTHTHSRVMTSLKKANNVDNTRVNAVPKTYAALLDEHGSEVVITDAQIRCALDAVEDAQLFPFGPRQTRKGRWVAAKAPARKLHS